MAWSSIPDAYNVGYLYVVSSMYFFSKYMKNDEITYLFISLVLGFASYGTHILLGSFLIPIIGILIVKRSYKVALLAILTLAMLLLAEWFVLWRLSDGILGMGRIGPLLQVVPSSLADSVYAIATNDVVHDLRYSLLRWINGSHFHNIIWATFLVALVITITGCIGDKRAFSLAHLLLMCSAICYGLTITLLPKSISPYLAALNWSSKYEVLFYIFATAVIVSVISGASINHARRKALDIFSGAFSFIALAVFVIGSEANMCSMQSYNERWTRNNIIEKPFCGIFFENRGADIFPQSAKAFALISGSVYDSIYQDYKEGKIGIPINIRGLSWLSIFEVHDKNYKRGKFGGGVISVDGRAVKYCLNKISSHNYNLNILCRDDTGGIEDLIKIANTHPGLDRGTILKTLLKGYSQDDETL